MGYASGWHDGGENERTTSSLCWSVSPRTQINFQKWWEHVTFQGCKSYRNLAAFQGSPPPFKWDNRLVYSTSVVLSNRNVVLSMPMIVPIISGF